MDTQEIEISIQDTTEREDPVVDSSGTVENELVACACGNQFSACDEGVSSLLKKCQSCYESLRYELEALESSDDFDDMVHLHPTDNEQSATGDTAPLMPAAATAEIGHVDMVLHSDQLTAAMMMAISDANKTFVLDLNGRIESFVYDFDPINASRSRKLFKRTSWTQKDLYWYNVFGAMHSQKGPVITPCAVDLTNETVILVAILETMCNRPRYDALVYDPSTKKASIVKYLLTQFKKLNMDVTINLEEMDSAVEELLIRERWFYDPQRGLKRTCKEPQKSDSQLKKYRTKDAIALSTTVLSDDDDDDKEAPPPVILMPRSKKRPNKPIKPIRAKPLKKAKTSRTLVAIDTEDTDDGDDDDVTSPASPRTLPVRAARNQPARTETTTDESTTNLYAPAPAAAVKSLLVAPPAPLLSSAQHTSLISASSSTTVERDIPNLFSNPMQMFARLQQHDVKANQFNEASSSSETMMMFSGLLYDNLAIKLKAEELERRERLRQENDNKSQFQAMFMAFANSLPR